MSIVMGNEVCCLDDRSRNQPRAITSNERLGYGILQSTHYAESDAGDIRTNQTTAQDTGRNNEAKLRQQLRDAGLKIVPIAGDGNCLFRALAHQLFGSDARHIEVRRACVAEMERDPDSYRPFLSDSEGVESRADFFKYLEDMRLPRRWGGHTELVAASRAYNVNVVVHRLGQPVRKEAAPLSGKASRDIQLSYHDANHYASVCPL
jgi:hypothetical protein